MAPQVNAFQRTVNQPLFPFEKFSWSSREPRRQIFLTANQSFTVSLLKLFKIIYVPKISHCKAVYHCKSWRKLKVGLQNIVFIIYIVCSIYHINIIYILFISSGLWTEYGSSLNNILNAHQGLKKHLKISQNTPHIFRYDITTDLKYTIQNNMSGQNWLTAVRGDNYRSKVS